MGKLGYLLIFVPLFLNIFFYLMVLLYFTGTSLSLDLNALVIGLIALAGILALIGIGSMFFQFSDVSVKIFISIGLYLGLWLLFSILNWNYFDLVPLGFGAVFYSILTGLFTVGCIMTFTNMNEGN